MDTLFFIALAVLLVGSWLLMRGPGRDFWISFFIALFVLLAIWELASVRTTGMTLSQHFWRFSDGHPREAWLILVCLGLGWALVLLHLARYLTRRKKK